MEETKKPEAHFTKGSGHMLNVFATYLGGGNNLRRSADAAVLLVKDASPMCGWGAVISDGDYANKMVSLTQLSCAEAGYTFGHELGHNMGLQHDKYSPRAGSGIVTPYSQGYHIHGTMFHTILAYPNDDQTVAANYYSNPRLAVGQYRLGKAGEADAAKRMTEVRFAIAGNGDESEACQLPGIFSITLPMRQTHKITWALLWNFLDTSCRLPGYHLWLFGYAWILFWEYLGRS